MTRMEIPNRITEKYSKMTKSEKRIADYLMQKKWDLELMSITDLAEQCSVADSTIFRFCKKLGYGGYNDFKIALAKEQGRVLGNSASTEEVDTCMNVTGRDSVQTTGQKLMVLYTAALEQTQELLITGNVEEAARIFTQAERVYCFGQGGSQITAMEAWASFITVSRHFETIQDTHMQVLTASMCTDKDAVWFFSYSGSTKDMVDILGQAKEHKAKVVLVTRYAKSPATQYADVVLLCGSNESPLQSGTIVAKISQLFVIDMVYQEYIRISPEMCETNRDLTSQAMANRLL